MVLSRYTFPFWSRKRRFSTPTLTGQAKLKADPAEGSTDELPEAVSSFSEVAPPVGVPFSGGEPDVGIAANVSIKVAATISRDLNKRKETF